MVARDQLGLGAGGFGMLVAFFGAGAVVGALWIPRHLQRMPLNTVVTGGYLLWIVAVAIIAAAPLVAAAVVGTCAAGAAWVSVLATLSAGTQSSAPAWVRARAVSTNLVANQASLALGSVIWGALASAAGTRIALAVSAGAMLVLLGLTRRVRVALGEEADVTGVQLPEFAIPVEPMPDDGPVLIQVEYRIDPQDRDAFLQRHLRDRADPPAQRRELLARLPRPRRRGALRRALRHRVLGGIRPPARAHDRGGAQAAGPRATAAPLRYADPRLALDRGQPAGSRQRQGGCDDGHSAADVAPRAASSALPGKRGSAPVICG